MRTLFVAAFISSIGGCAGPDYGAVANRLREKTLEQDREIATLKEQLANRDATIASLREKGPPAVPTLPSDRLSQLFTAARIEIRANTDTWDNGDGKGISAFRIFIRMYAADGQIIPAAGVMSIEAFELPPTPAEPRRLGTWKFTPEEMKKSWFSGLGLNHFAFTCPWTAPPNSTHLTFKARFEDSLTGNTLEAQLDKNITLPVRDAATR